MVDQNGNTYPERDWDRSAFTSGPNETRVAMTPAEPTPIIGEQVELLMLGISTLDEQIAMLIRKLDPVLDPKRVRKERPDVAPLVESPLAGALRMQVYRLHDLIDVLKDVHGGLEI